MKIQAALISLFAFTTLACSYAKGAPYIVEGERYPDNRLDAIEEGMTMARVRELLGEPLEIAKEDDTERWRYYVWQRQDETIRYLGFIPTRKPHYNGKKTATVVFRSSLVTEVSFRHEVLN